MTDGSRVRPGPQQFVLRAELPFRALAIGSGGAVAGAGLLVLWRSMALSPAVAVLGGLLLAFAVAVTVAAVLAARRWRQTVTLDEEGITVVSGRTRRTLAWSDIKRVTLDGDRAVLEGDQHSRTEVSNPHGPSERVFVALLEEMTARLDASRGYRPFE